MRGARQIKTSAEFDSALQAHVAIDRPGARSHHERGDAEGDGARRWPVVPSIRPRRWPA